MCVEEVAGWFAESGILLNPAKTEPVLFGTKVQHDKITTAIDTDVAGTVVPFCDNVKLLGVTLDSAVTMDRHVTKVIRSWSYHTRAPTPTHCCMAHRLTTSTGCRWHTTRWPEWCVKPQVPPVLPSYVSSSTGCQLSWRSSHTRHDLPALRFTYLTSSTDIYQHAHHDRPTNIVTFSTSDTASVEGESLQRQRSFSLELTVI